MKDIETIMVALGFSQYAQETFDYAAKLAQNLGADLFIASVINVKDVEAVRKISAMGYDVDGEHYVQGIKDERKQQLKQILDKSPYRHDHIRIVFRIGHPVDELLKVIVQENVHMVVMGLKGRTGLEHVLVGSVAEKLFRKSPVPIVSYRDKKSAEKLRQRLRTEKAE
jgi:nucleotide-binding universal stress UspA family protein